MDDILNYMDTVILDSLYESTRVAIESRICQAPRENAYISMLARIVQERGENLCVLLSDLNRWQKDSIPRQCLSVFFLTWSISSFFYLLFGTICHYRNFDPLLKKRPNFHRNQIGAEIADSLIALFWLNVWTMPIFMAQIHGFSKIYKVGSASWWYEVVQIPFFVLFSDTCMYWLHRAFHIPLLFKMMHHKHHRYVIPTPFSAYAFYPLEAWIMSLPIYAYSFIWPMSDLAQLVVFGYTNIWTFLLHDNREQFHTVHHKNINFNFGQYLTLWDHLGGTYKDPHSFLTSSINGEGKKGRFDAEMDNPHT